MDTINLSLYQTYERIKNDSIVKQAQNRENYSTREARK